LYANIWFDVGVHFRRVCSKKEGVWWESSQVGNYIDDTLGVTEVGRNLREEATHVVVKPFRCCLRDTVNAADNGMPF
jgi:hypothetical protein